MIANRNILDGLLNRRESWGLLLLFGLLLRLVAWLWVTEHPLVGDSLFYSQYATQLLEGNLEETYWPPGLPLYEAAWMWIFGDSEALLRLCMFPWFIFLARGTYNFFYRVHSRPAANLAVFGLVIYPDLIHHSVEPLSHLPTAACLMYVLNQALIHARHERANFLGLGLALGYLTLLRPSLAVFIFLIPAWMFLQRRRMVASTVVGMIATLLVGGWIWILSSQHGRFIPVNESNARNFYLGNNAWTPDYKTWYLGSHWEGEPEVPEGFRRQLRSIETLHPDLQSRAFAEAAWQHVKQHPGRFLKRSSARVRTFFAFDTFTGARLVSHHGLQKLGLGIIAFNAIFFSIAIWLAGSVLLGAWRKLTGGSVVLLLAGTILAYAIPYWLAFSHPTYHLALLPVVFGLAGIPLARWLIPLGDPISMPKGAALWKMVIWGLIVVGVQTEWLIQMMP